MTQYRSSPGRHEHSRWSVLKFDFLLSQRWRSLPRMPAPSGKLHWRCCPIAMGRAGLALHPPAAAVLAGGVPPRSGSPGSSSRVVPASSPIITLFLIGGDTLSLECFPLFSRPGLPRSFFENRSTINSSGTWTCINGSLWTIPLVAVWGHRSPRDRRAPAVGRHPALAAGTSSSGWSG